MSPLTSTIVIEEVGASKAALDIELVAARAADVLPTWPVINALFHADEESRFARSGPGWAPLAETTLAIKASLGQSPDVLRASENLYRSLTTAAFGRDRSLPSRLVFGTDVAYGLYHQYGTVNMPQRKLMGWSPTLRAAAVRVITEFIEHGVA